MVKYLNNKLSRGFLSLYVGKIILQLAYGAGSLFLPIFLYKIFNFRIEYVFLFYILNFGIYVLVVAFGAKFLNRFGFRRSLRLSAILGTLYYLSFYLIALYPHNIFFLIIVPLLFINLFRVFYWLPYHIDFAKFTNKKDRGKQFSILQATRLLVGVISPILFGFLIDRSDFKAMFLAGAFIYSVSFFPYFFIPRTKEKFSWSYKKTWQEFFSKKNRKIVLAYLGDGSDNAVGIIIWPIFIWEILKGNYFQVGAVSTLIVGATVILQLLLGRYTDMANKKNILKIGSFFYSLGWIAKIFVFTAFQIFITATYHNLSRIFFRTPLDVLTYEIAADEGHYVDEFTVIHEMSLNLGRVLLLVLALAISFFLSIEWTFAMAALAVLLVNALDFEKLGR